MSVYAQKMTVTGKVTSVKDKEPIIGVTVLVKGTNQGTMTDLEGNYSLSNVSGNATIIYSMVGFKKQTANVNGKAVINVSLDEDVSVSSNCYSF